MADRIVYLVDKIPATDTSMELITDADLAAIMGEGYEVTTTTERSIKVGSKKIKATMMILRPAGENRGVSISGRGRERDRDGDGGMGGMMTVTDDFGMERKVSLGQMMVQGNKDLKEAMLALTNGSHLGGGRNHSFPGVTVISAEVIGKARDMGTQAGMRGLPASSCPFPPGSEPQRIWLSGWSAASNRSKEPPTKDALKRAESEGYDLAKSLPDPDLQVGCPYPVASPFRESWIEGFKRGGGRVE
jgi:ribosome modulation factor